MNILQKIKILMALSSAENKIEEAYKMNPVKPGWKTTEFWVAVTTQVLAVAGALKGVMSEHTAGIVMAIATAAYSIARSFVKANPTTTPTTNS